MPMSEQDAKARFLEKRKEIAKTAKRLGIITLNVDEISCRLKKSNPHGRTDRYFDRSGQTIEWDERGNIKSITPGRWRSHTYYSLLYRAKQSRLGKVRTLIKRHLSERILDQITVKQGKSAMSREEEKEYMRRFHAQKHGRFM